MSLFEQFVKDQATKSEADKTLPTGITSENIDSKDELISEEQDPVEVKPIPNPPRRKESQYDVYNPQALAYKGITIEAASKNSQASGKYINAEGQIADLNISGFQSQDGKWFGSNGMVYLKPLHSPTGDAILEKTEGSFAQFVGRMAADAVSKYDPETVLRMLVPGINPENGEPILREEIGTRKDFAEREIALTQAYGFQDDEDGLMESFTKGLFGTLQKSDEMLLGAASFLTMNQNPGLKNALSLAIEKNNVHGFIGSKESEDAFTWDWFGQGLGNALASQAQFGVAGKVGNFALTQGLKLGGKAAFQNFAKREMMEKIARYGASGTVGFGYAMAEAKRSGLDDNESWMFALTVGGLNTLIESKLNVDFDRALMGSTTRVITQNLMRELNGEVTETALNAAGKSVLNAILSGGKTALKSAGGEALEEVMQTGVEQTARTIHELFASDRKKGEGRFEESGFDMGEILEAGFFGAIAAGPSAMAMGFTGYDPKQSYMEKMIREGKGKLILSGIDNLLDSKKVTPEAHARMKKEALFKVEVFDKNKEAFFNLNKMTNSQRIQSDLFGLFKQKAARQLESETLLAKLGKNPEQNIAITKAEAEAVKAEMATVDTKIKEVQEKIDQYKNRNFVNAENSRYQKVVEQEEEVRAQVFERFSGSEISAKSFDEIMTRYDSMSELEKSATPLFRNATEAKLMLDAVRNGEAAKRFDPKDIDQFLENVGQQLKVTKFYLNSSVNTDENRKFLTDELGIDEAILPLTASEKKKALTNPGEFAGRFMTNDELEMITQDPSFQEDLSAFMVKHNLDPTMATAEDIRLAQLEMLVTQGAKYKVTDGMLHSLNESDQVLALLENDAQRTAFSELLAKSDKPFALITDQKGPGEKTSGFHYAQNGVVALRFNKARIQELLAKKLASPLTKEETNELKTLQDDLFHKLTHETSHNFFDYGINVLFNNYHKNPKSEDGILYQRLLDLAGLTYNVFKDKKKYKDLYFFKTVGENFASLSGQEQYLESSSFIKEFFAEAMSNKDFQEALDSFDLSAKSNQKILARFYHYPEIQGGTVKSLLKEVLDAFHGVLGKVKNLLTGTQRTILQEAMVLGSNIQVNRFSLNSRDEVASIASMDISMFNPKLLIDQVAEFAELDALPFLISRRLAEEGFNMNDDQYRDFTGRIKKYIDEEIASKSVSGVEAQSLKVIYFKTTDSFLITHNSLSADGTKLITNRQFFNRYANKESVNTNVFNEDKENSLKKHYTFDDYLPKNDLDKTIAEKKQLSDNFRAAQEEGFSGETTLFLNEEKIFGTRDQKFKGEIEIIYTFADGSKRVIGYAPDLSKPRLARMLKLGATIPVNVSLEGPGSKAFVLYNTPGDKASGLKRVVNPKDYKGVLTPEMIQEGYVEEKAFMPKTVFRFDVANVKIESAVKDLVNVHDSLTSMDENLPVDWSLVKGLNDQNFLKHEFDESIANSVLGENPSWYRDLDNRNKFDERAWFFRDRIKREIRYRAMTGTYSAVQLQHATSAMISLSAQELKRNAESEIEIERAERLGFLGEDEFLDYIDESLSEKSFELYQAEASAGIKQDWSGHGLNPNETIFAMVKAQIEHLVYMDPATGKKQLLNISNAREVLLMASRESATFRGMVERLLTIQQDPKMTGVQKEIARSLYNFYSSPVTDAAVIKRLASQAEGVTERMLSDVSEMAASRSTGTQSFRDALGEIALGGDMTSLDGSQSTYNSEQIETAAFALVTYYSTENPTYNGLIRYFGSNSLFTAFASLRKVDSISIIPIAGGGSIISYNGKSKIKDEQIAQNEIQVRRVLEKIKAENMSQKEAQAALHQLIKDKYAELFGDKFGEFPKEFNNVGTSLYYNQFFAQPGKLTGLDKNKPGSVSDNWMQTTDAKTYGKLARVLKAFYATFDIDLPNGMLLRHEERGAQYFLDLEQRMDLEFLEEMADNNIQEGTEEYQKAYTLHENDKRKYVNLMKQNRYVYPVAKFGKKTGSNSSEKKDGNQPMLALALQAAHFLNTKSLSYFGGDMNAEIMGDEMKKLSEEQLMFGRVNQSDEMYFDPKGNKRFSLKIKSHADTMMEDLAMNKAGILNEMLSSSQWEHSTVLKKISENRGKPIDVMLSGLRSWNKGMVYSESTDIDFAYMNLAAFTSLYDYSEDYIHVDDIPSDKPTIYGYRLNRIEKGSFVDEIRKINSSERRKRAHAKQLLKQAFSSEIGKGKDGATIIDQAVFDSLVENVHYTVKDGLYYPGKIVDPSKSFFGKVDNAVKILAEMKAEARATYQKMLKQGLEIPLNRNFIQENDPIVILDNLRKELIRINDNLETFSNSKHADNWLKRVNELKKEIPKREQSLSADQSVYVGKAAARREELFVDEFYPNYVVNRYHLSRLLMGDAIFYKDVFDMNKRKAGPAAPFYKGSWKRAQGKLVALEDVGEERDKTFVGLPSISFSENTNKWEIAEDANTIATARTDAQGYATEQFAQEMVDAYGAFSGFKKIFKPVMFGVNKEHMERAQPLYMKLSVAIILDPRKPKNQAHYEKYPEQLAFAEKFYASGGDLALFRTGVKVGFKNQSRVEDESYTVQTFDLDKFGLQNDPEKTVEDEESEIAGGVQLHKQLADNGNFQKMLAYYQIESEMLRRDLNKAIETGDLSELSKLRAKFIAELQSKSHTAELGEWLRDNNTELFDHPFTSESIQNMAQSLFNKLGTLPKKPGKKFVNLSDFGFDKLMPTQNDLDKTRLYVERGVYPDGFQDKEYIPKWAGPRKVEDLHRLDQKEFKNKTESGVWQVNEETGIIQDSSGKPVIFPADVLVPENSGLSMGSRLINTRIPTTGKASNIPSRIVGYLPAELGNVIVVPKHGPGILGFDFDVDGLFAWNETGGSNKNADALFEIAFSVLTDAKNFNELTSPVGTDKLSKNAKFYSVSEQEAKQAWDRGEEVAKAESNPNGLLDYGFARQLEMMKMNSIGKVFIGASASFSAIYSVFSQTGTEILSNKMIKRIHVAPGAKPYYPQHTENGDRGTDIFVQLINAAADNVKEMQLAKNNINLVTGDVVMDLVAHGVDLDYALALINQPAIRDLVKLHDKNDSATTADDFMTAEDRMISQYEAAIQSVWPEFKWKSQVFRKKGISDKVYFSQDQLTEMYFSGNKKMSVADVTDFESMKAFVGNNIQGENERKEVIQRMVEQIQILEKFKFYKMLSNVTRQGGTLVMMYSKNPKNYAELKKVIDKIEKAYFSENPKLSHGVFEHPSYSFQWDLLRDNKRFYEDNMLVANPEVENYFINPVVETIGISNIDQVHDAFINSLVLKNLQNQGINSSVINGFDLTSLEFNEMLVRLLKDNIDQFSGNKFMQQLTFKVSENDIDDISKGKGEASKIEFNGTKQFTDIEIREIQAAFSELENLDYHGNQVDIKAALIYYLAITKGFGLGGYNFSKIIPNSEGSVMYGINETLKGFKDVLLSDWKANVDSEALETQDDFQNTDLGYVDEATDYSAALAELTDDYLVDTMDQFLENFHMRNDQFKPTVHRNQLLSIIRQTVPHPDSVNPQTAGVAFVGPLKVDRVESRDRFSFVEDAGNVEYMSFLEKAIQKKGFAMIDKSGNKRVFTLTSDVAQEGSVKTEIFTFVERLNRNVNGLYEPFYFDSSPQQFYSKPKTTNKGVDISGSLKHQNEKNPTLQLHFTKDMAKFNQVTKLISRGSELSSSHSYAEAAGPSVSNTGKYNASDIVGISAEGNRENRIGPDFIEIQKAMDAGATLVTDKLYDRNSNYNIGEQEVARYLQDNGYMEVSDGRWSKNNNFVPWKNRVVYAEESIGDLEIAIRNQAVIVAYDPQIVPMILTSGYRRSKMNPTAFLSLTRDFESYSTDQYKTLKNKC